MNIVKLMQSKTSLKIKVEINGEKVSDFSELITILQAPFLDIADRIIAQLDLEIYDEYQIYFSGHFFQYKVLSSYAEKSPYCKNVIFDKVNSFYTEEETEQILSLICNNHKLAVKEKRNNIPVYSETSLATYERTTVETSIEEAEICVFKNVENITCFGGQTVLLLGTTVELLKINEKAVLQLPEGWLSDFFEFYYSYNYHINYIADCKNALSFVRLSPKEEKQIDSVLNNKADYYVSEIPAVIDDTDCVTFDFESYPKDKYHIFCNSPYILNVSNNIIEPLTSGKTDIIIKDEKDNILYSQEIEVISHQYVTEIRIVPCFSELKINERNKIDVVVLPQSAEDAKEILYTSSDENVLTIDNDGNILALNSGKATITVSGKKIKASLDVTIMPNLEKIYFSEDVISLKIGQTKIVECNTVPADASTSGFVWQFDNNSIASINYSTDGRKCKITAATQKEGKGNLRCYDPKTGFSAVCPIDVYARVKLNLIEKLLYLLSAIGFFCAPVLLIPIVIDVILLLNTKEEQKKKIYIFNIIFSVILGIAGLIIFS